MVAKVSAASPSAIASRAVVAASPASFQPSKAASSTGPRSRGRRIRVVWSMTPPCHGRQGPRRPGLRSGEYDRAGAAGSPDGAILLASKASSPVGTTQFAKTAYYALCGPSRCLGPPGWRGGPFCALALWQGLPEGVELL